MGMNTASWSGNHEPEVVMEVNTTPLIDVMLVLLVMLIITIPMQLHTIPLPMGGDATAPVHKPIVHVVSIDFDGTVSWDDQLLADSAAVEAKMREIGAMAEANQPEVHVKPNKLADYGAVAAVMASMQRNGVRKMGVLGNERFTS
ncbi:ExbD/TolR family protein [Roseateles sp. P5_E8]